jgi:elongation factor Ts
MSDISPQMVKELRERTGVGMSKCKEALDEAKGNMEKAIEILRKAGMTSAVKKEEREAKEGLIGYYETKDAIALVEVNCETDFVAQNEKFKIFIDSLAKQVAELKINSLDSLLNKPSLLDKTMSVEQYRNIVVQALGENIQVRRLLLIEKSLDSSYGIYAHMKGKILSVVELKGASGEDILAKDIAMHIAASSPDYLNANAVPKDVIEKEKEIARSQITGKPENVVEKIVMGKLQAFFDEVCLVCQKYVKDPNISIQQLVDNKGKSINKSMQINHFWRWKVGDGR